MLLKCGQSSICSRLMFSGRLLLVHVTEIAVAGCVVSLVIQGIVSGWMDAVSIYICPLGAMLAAIMFFWVAGKKFAVDAVNAGADKPVGKWFVPLGKYVLVPLSLVALIAGALLGGIGRWRIGLAD